MEANVNFVVELETIPRLIGHLLSEEELKLDPLTRLIAKAANSADNGNIIEAMKFLQEVRNALRIADSRIEQCETILIGATTPPRQEHQPSPRETEKAAKDITPQAEELRGFSDFVSKMNTEPEKDNDNEDASTQEG